MLFIYGILIAIQIVLGQVLWKTGAEKYTFVLSKDFITSKDFISFILSPFIIIGVVSYASATIIFMAMLAKYDYTNLQSIVVSSSLVLTFMAAILLFDEKITILNIVGLACLIMGVVFITKF